MATGDITDPYGSYRFLVEIDSISRAAFQECTGFDQTIEVTEYREGGDNLTTRKVPGRTSYSNIQLKWGMTDDSQLWEWHQSVARGQIERKNGSIVLLGRDGQEVRRWNFSRAWPAKWTGPDLNASGSDIAIEMVELVHEGIELAS